MKPFFQLLITLFLPLISWAQTNFQSGDITNCYTWDISGNLFVQLDTVSVKPTTSLSINDNISLSSFNLNDGTVALQDKTVNLSGTTDLKCGGQYGEQQADGKFIYANTSSCILVMNGDYNYKTATLTLGPLKKDASYKWNKCRVTLINLFRFTAGCTTCWTTDWNLVAKWNSSDGRGQSVTSYIWSNRDRLFKATICGLYGEVYTNSFIFNNREIPGGQTVTVSINTPVTSGSTAASKSCCIAPILYVSIEAELQEL